MAYDIQVSNALSSSAQYLKDESSSHIESPLSLTNLSTGKVGICTNNPECTLHVCGDNKRIINSGNSSNGYNTVHTRNSDNDNLELVAYGRSVSGTYLGQPRGGSLFVGSTPNTVMGIGTRNEKPVIIGTDDIERMRITPDGKVGIGTKNPEHELVVSGNAQFSNVISGMYCSSLNLTFDGTLTVSTSDKRMKKGIAKLKNVLDKVTKLRGVHFKWKSDKKNTTRIGLIAQEVEEIFPELVFTNPTDGYKGIHYGELTAVLIEAIKEQQSKIVSLEKKLALHTA